MKRLFLVLMVILCSGVAAAEPPSDVFRTDAPVADTEWNTRTKTLLVRSCIGEAGFHALDECAAIAYVYATRAEQTGIAFQTVIRQYSSAIKAHERHRRPWIFEINLAGTRPASWPENLSWPKHRAALFDLVQMLDRWAAGFVPNPVPGANHYGSMQDFRASDYFTKRMLLPAPHNFRNRFFDDTGKNAPVGQALVRWRQRE